jgi:hypothetical protein
MTLRSAKNVAKSLHSALYRQQTIIQPGVTPHAWALTVPVRNLENRLPFHPGLVLSRPVSL